jgi:molybdate transport system regulatory protein
MRFVGPLKLTARVYCGDEIAIGPGKADLLEAIDREGSISAAGRTLGMSYRRAWMLVDVMNRCWREPLVEASAGRTGRGSRLTPAGHELLLDYRALESSLCQAATEPLRRITRRLLKAPRPAGAPASDVRPGS